jgi:hydroxymethylpyrimidine/phosphomethylpyrimidine kinase
MNDAGGGTRPVVLLIAATDSSGGAGITRDVQVLADFSADALCVITAVTVQSDSRLTGVHHIPPEVIRAQVAAAFEARRIDAIKIGMLGTRATVDAVVDSLAHSVSLPIVLDPVLVSSSGGVLLDAGGRDAMRRNLFPRAALVTPNVPEAAALLDADIANSEPVLIEQAESLLALGPQAVLIKGGHLCGEGASHATPGQCREACPGPTMSGRMPAQEEAVDLLVSRDHGLQRIPSPRLRATRRGTGCTLASAIAAGVASGMSLSDACGHAKRYVQEMLSRQ